jgi:flavin reductase (DIM6/NTAB) family NADH-FMN oxidoreductase RutF
MADADAQKQLAAALGRVPSGLFIVTARQGDAETGMLASWVQQCSFNPPQVSLALRSDRPIAAWLTPDAFFALNVLDDGQTDMIGHFGRGFELNQSAFNGLEITRLPSGPVVLDEALAYLECQVVARHPGGDHDLIIARVVAGRMLSEGHPMVHVRRSGMHY